MRSALRSAWRVPGRAPLRVKLVATLLILLLGALLGSGIAARATMRSYLISRVDDPLRSAVHGPGRDGDETVGPRTGDRDHRGVPSDFVRAELDANGKLVAPLSSKLIDPTQPLPTLPSPTAAESARRGQHLFTVPAGSGGGRWRVLAVPLSSANGPSGTLLVAQSLDPVDTTISRLTLLLVIIGAVAVGVFAGVGYVVVRVSLRPLQDVERTAAAIAGGDLTRRVPQTDPRTEIGQLSGALNTMLGEIETAFAARAASEEAARRSEESARRSEDRMRRFVADASHELRTPLTSIRGFAELYRQGAAADPADVTRLMTRIEDEAKRMGLLVEDLLMLARLDQQRPLARAPVDLLALANDAVHDAQAVDPARHVRLEVGATDPPPIVVGDEARLRQVLAHLVGNALQHTPAGTPVTVRVETAPPTGSRRGTVAVTVADRGPGMSEDDAARVFERFYRADPSRSRNEGGTGLGLAIVSALVAGHDGTVSVDTAPGRGAAFRVELPLADGG